MPIKIASPRWQKNRAALTHAHYAATLHQLPPGATTVLKMIASATDFGTWARSTNSIAHLADLCRLARSTVEKALRRLRELGLIARDGHGPYNPGRPGLRRVVYYRLGSTPSCPLPARVLCARENHDPDVACTYCATCDDTYIPKDPKGPFPASGTQPHLPSPVPARSAEGDRPEPARAGGSVNAAPMHARTRPAPTPPKGRPTPRRQQPPATDPHPALAPAAHVLGRLAPGQRRLVHRRLAAVMAGQGIGARRMAERLRHWHVEDPRSPVGWLLYAMATAPHGCPRPDCENGTLWDPGADAAAGRCPNCTVRVHDRALASGTWRAAAEEGRTQSTAGGQRLATQGVVFDLIECARCDRPIRKTTPSVTVCRDCRTAYEEEPWPKPSPAPPRRHAHA